MINARKHSRATRLDVLGALDGRMLVFDVIDDGIGFRVDEALALDRFRMHIGLAATIQRVRLAGGQMAVTSGRGEGAHCHITIPAEPRTR